MTINIDRSFLEQADLVSLIEQQSPTRFGKPAGNGTKRTVKGPCPFCGGTDRFAVFINDSPQRYLCGIHGNGCGAHGDAIDFLRQYEHLLFREAVATLTGEDIPQVKYTRRLERTSEVWRSQEWQQRVTAFCKTSAECIWSDSGGGVLAYLIGRGLSSATIRKAHLGAVIKHEVPYLIIPWYSSKYGHYWRVTLRDIRPGIVKPYKNLTGSSVTDGMYCADSLVFHRPVFLVEGELDALSLAQEAGDLVSVVASGTKNGSHALDWVMELATMPHVFVAFDAEEKAEQAAAYWTSALPNATRWRTPLGKDANEMLQRGLNIRLWVEAALDSISEPITVPPAPELPTNTQNGHDTSPPADTPSPLVFGTIPPKPKRCFGCHGRDFRLRFDNVWVCRSCNY